MVRGSNQPTILDGTVYTLHMHIDVFCVFPCCNHRLWWNLSERQEQRNHRGSERRGNTNQKKIKSIPVCYSKTNYPYLEIPSNPLRTGSSPGKFKRAIKVEFFSKNCRRPKRVRRVRMCNLQSAKNCASVETSQATVHARAQEMKKSVVRARSRLYTFPMDAHGPVG